MFARFDENPAMTLEDIKETKRYGRTDARTDNVKTVYPPQTKFAGGIKRCLFDLARPTGKNRADSENFIAVFRPFFFFFCTQNFFRFVRKITNPIRNFN